MALYRKIRDEYCDKIADSLTELDWVPDVEGINRLHHELERLWRKSKKLRVPRTALYGSNLARSTGPDGQTTFWKT